MEQNFFTEDDLFIKHNSISYLIRSKKDWIEYFNSANIEYVDVEEEYGVDFFNDLMPDFYFPQIDFISGKKSEGFFASLNYTPIFMNFETGQESPFMTFEDLLNPSWKEVKYIDFLIKNKKPVLFLNEFVEFTPTTFLHYESGNYSASQGIPFAYLIKESYGNIWCAAGDEDFTQDYLKLQLTK